MGIPNVEDLRLRNKYFVLAASVLLFTFGQAHATLINFNATGVTGVSGYVQFDDVVFDGTSSQELPNTTITDLMLTVFGESYTVADVALGALTFVDSTGFLPRIVNGGGNLADNGLQSISFFPDGFDGTALDGDASLGIGPGGGFANEDFYAVQWVPGAAGSVPLPATIVLLGLGLAGFGCQQRRRQRHGNAI